ncbi:unnamed protein product [Durusdinium trenchii]|uniref:Uncharacterized protein n=1 Tax=Durusdinium trenchii TaxID=1381693 RepID=A0ABP0MPD0_9DINO
MAFAAALALLVAAPAVLLASATSLTAPSSTSGVSGRRFSGERLREVPELRFTGWRSRWQERCERWIVVTSIFAPSEATRSLGAMTKQGWCFVVVADQNGPQALERSELSGRAEDYDVEGVIYLTVERQKALHFHIMDYLPWRHFGRVSVTIHEQEKKEPRIPILGDELAANVSWPEGDPGGPGLMNPYPSFQPSCGHMWPRGFPLDYVQAQETFNKTIVVKTLHGFVQCMLRRAPAVQQFLADEDPDVDAIFRLTRRLPCSFAGLDEALPPVMAIPPRSFTPYNAQATVHLYDAFWGLLLPVTVHGRVSDIWRAYLTQKLLWDVGQVITFTPAHVVHDRVAHDYLKDFQSEGDLQLKSTAMVEFLSRWSSSAPSLLERLEELWAELYARHFVELGDLRQERVTCLGRGGGLERSVVEEVAFESGILCSSAKRSLASASACFERAKGISPSWGHPLDLVRRSLVTLIWSFFLRLKSS